MNISERIESGSQDLANLKDALFESTKALEAAPDEECLLVEVEELAAKVEKATDHLEALKKAEKALAARAEAVAAAPAVAPNLAKHNAYKSEEPGDLMFKHATAKFLAYAKKQPVEQVLEENYGDQPVVKETFDYIRKSAVNPAMTTTTGWAAELVRSDTRSFLASLEDVSVAASLASMATSLDFGGFGSVTIPTENATAATPTEPAWVNA